MPFTPLTPNEVFNTLATLSSETELKKLQDYISVNWQFYTPIDLHLFLVSINILKQAFNHEEAI